MWQPGKVVWLSCLSSPVFSSACFSRASSAGEPSHHWTLSGVVSWRTCSTHSATAGERSCRAVNECGAVAISGPQLSVCPDETTEYSGETVIRYLGRDSGIKQCAPLRGAHLPRADADSRCRTIRRPWPNACVRQERGGSF